MNWFEHFFSISFYTVNLFSFMMGMLYTLSNISTFGNPKKLWLQVVAYIALVGVYFFLKSENYI